MKPEVLVAAKWWANCLRSSPSYVSTLSCEMIDVFEKMLAKLLEDRYNNTDWRPEQSIWGSYKRAISNDYNCDLVLKQCAEIVGFDATERFPIKTTMLVNPGIVKVGCGHGCPFEIIYGKET